MEGHNFERIIGGTDEDKEKASIVLQEAHDGGSKRYEEKQIEKTPEDIQIIDKTQKVVNEMVQYFGGSPKDVPIEHVYVLEPGGVSSVSEGKILGGVHITMSSRIGVDRNESNFLFASTIAHEMFHLTSYKSAYIKDPEYGPDLYRHGLQMVDKKDDAEKAGQEKKYFAQMEEAIVAECTRRFLKKIGSDPLFAEDFQALEKIKNWVINFHRKNGASEERIAEFESELKFIPNPTEVVKIVLGEYDDENNQQAMAAGMFARMFKEKSVEFMERLKERKKMYALLDEILVASSGVYQNRDEIFDDFARANFTGNYLPLAKKVEAILGKGSFRKIAEDFAIDPHKK